MRSTNKHTSLSRAVEYRFDTLTDGTGKPIVMVSVTRLIEGIEQTSHITVCEADMEQFSFLLQQSFVEMQIQESQP